jgi:hypothetical protein
VLPARLDADLSIRPITVAILDPITVTIMAAMLAPEVMTVDPTMTTGPMAGYPDHLVFAFPVTRTMTVIWPVTKFDAKPCRLNGGPESEARNANRHEQ